MSGALEQSLDDIIGDNRPGRRREHPGRRSGGRGGGQRRVNFGRPQGSGIPGQILKSAEGRPMLRLRNVHPDLNGMDLSELFLNIAPVDFVKFDPRDESIAYVCFQSAFAENNARAIQRFDGKKAMGNILTVEIATSLADRITPTQNPRSQIASRESARARESTRPREQHRVKAKAKQQKERKPKPVKKSAEDLDKELSAYMNGGVEENQQGQEQTTSGTAFAAQDNGEVTMD